MPFNSMGFFRSVGVLSLPPQCVSYGYKYIDSGVGFRVDSLWTSLRDHGEKLCTARGQQAAHRLHTASPH